MSRLFYVAGVMGALVAGAAVGTHSSKVVAESQPVPLAGATLLPGLGHYEFTITTRQAEAQRWFNQGLMLT